MSIHMKHTHECLGLIKKLEAVNWCPGNGACGYSSCTHDQLRHAKIVAHKTCEVRYGDRLKELARKTSGDGKARASGEKDEVSLLD